MFPAEIERLQAQMQPLFAQLATAAQDPSVSTANIRAWEREALDLSTRINDLSVQYGYPHIEIGRAQLEGTIRFSTLLALLMRASAGGLTRQEAERRIVDLKQLYRTCVRLAPGVDGPNSMLLIDFRDRLEKLSGIERNLDNVFAGNLGSQPKPGGCYIATAVYGSYDAPPVLVLRRFRDERLQRSRPGRAFVRAYYRLSPPLASRLGSATTMNRAVRAILDRVVGHLEPAQERGDDSPRTTSS